VRKKWKPVKKKCRKDFKNGQLGYNKFEEWHSGFLSNFFWGVG
jgi:hypothetical protein